jgi:hypothetical protein
VLIPAKTARRACANPAVGASITKITIKLAAENSRQNFALKEPPSAFIITFPICRKKMARRPRSLAPFRTANQQSLNASTPKSCIPVTLASRRLLRPRSRQIRKTRADYLSQFDSRN